MNRLAPRLIIAMVVVALASLLVVPIAQSVAARKTFNRLNPEFRELVLERTRPPRLWQGNRPRAGERGRPPFSRENDPMLSEQNTRLFALLGSYRAAIRQAIALGSAAAVLLSIALAVWLGRSIAKPIGVVARAASVIAGGDLSARATLAGLGRQPTEAQQLARDFNAMASSLEAYEAERKAMTADIAHELRTPLATLQLRLDALQDGLVTFDGEELELLKQQVGLMSRLIDDLRTLSLADAGRLSLDLREVEWGELMGSVVKSFRERADQAGVRLEFTPPADRTFVSADPDRMTQVAMNLLDNAVRMTPADGWVRVILAKMENECVLSVLDSGPGVPEDELDTIFERFVRGERRDSRVQQGSGLGLAIVHSLVTLHGGQVRAGNHAEGAYFEVVLPLLGEYQ